VSKILSIKPGDEKRLNSHALSRINDWEARILNKVAQLGPVNIEQIKAYTNTYLDDNEMAEFKKCLADIRRWLAGCMDSGNGYYSCAYATWVIDPMTQIESFILMAYQRAEAEQQNKEYKERWRAALKAINPPVDDAKKYLNHKEYDEFAQTVGQAIDVYLEKGVAYLDDVRTLDYVWWLRKIQKRKKDEAQKLQAICAANEYNHRLNQEIAKLTSRLEHKQIDLASYFWAQIQDKRYTDHNLDYVISKEDETNFDGILVRVANKRLEQLLANDLPYFIILPSQYYRLYFPLPKASYISRKVPCIDLSFEIFAAAYAEVCLKPGKKSFYDYEFLLPYREEKNYLVLPDKARFLGYHYLVLTPEDLGCIFWRRIPLVLLKALLNGEAKPDGTTISAASDSVTMYKVQGFEEEVSVPDEFVEYMKSIGSIDGMVATGIVTEKVGNIVKTALGELEAKLKILPDRENARGRDSSKERAFRLFDEGRRPGDPKVKALGIKPNSAYRYYQDWKKACNRSQS